MVKSISLKTRWIIVVIYSHCLGSKLPLSTICKRLHVGLATARHWVQVCDETGDVQEITRSDRPKTTNIQEDEVIKNMVLSQAKSSNQNISTNLKSIGIGSSSSTICRRLSSLDVVYGRPISKPLLSKNHLNERLCFARRNKNINRNKVLFTDENIYQLFYNPEKNWMKWRKKAIY